MEHRTLTATLEQAEGSLTVVAEKAGVVEPLATVHPHGRVHEPGGGVESPLPVPPSKSAPVKFDALPGSDLRSPETCPAGVPVVGKFPATLASLVAGDIPALCAYETIRFLPFAPATVKSAPAAMSEEGSYDARAESAPKPEAPNPDAPKLVARANTPNVPPGSPEDETRNLSGLSFSFL